MEDLRNSETSPTLVISATERHESFGIGLDHQKRQRSARQRPSNPLQSGLSDFLLSQRSRNRDGQSERFAVDHKGWPKRYTLYSPLLLLPPNFTAYSPQWQHLYSLLSFTERDSLFHSIAVAFKAQGVSHIAINAPISREDTGTGEANVMRRPSGLVPVYGDFGPIASSQGADGDRQPSSIDFQAAFWVSTVQNAGIVQVWAPLWTMFSRGNISEKTRILGDASCFGGMSEEALGKRLDEVDVIDFYCGIGYFMFPYLKRGVRRVWGWEINDWSVEGLRKGAQKNGWETLVFKVDNDGELTGGDKWLLLEKTVDGKGELKCVVFHGDNKWAGKVMADIMHWLEKGGHSQTLNLRHANLGLLPTSRTSWHDAVQCLDKLTGGWLHVHENVDIRDVELKKEEILGQIESMVREQRGMMWTISCCHVEKVKTYAPGIMHCVFDIQILPAR